MKEPDYLPAALADLEAILDYIANDSPGRALRFVERIQARCLALCTHPRLGPARDDIARGLRILPLPPRVVVAYRIRGDAVLIVRVFYGGQDYETILRAGNDPSETV